MFLCMKCVLKCCGNFYFAKQATLLVTMLNCLLTQTTNYPTTLQQLCTWVCSRGKDGLMKFKLTIRSEQKGDWSDFGCNFRQAGPSVSQTADLLGFSNWHSHPWGSQRMIENEKRSSAQQLCGGRCLVDVKGQNGEISNNHIVNNNTRKISYGCRSFDCCLFFTATLKPFLGCKQNKGTALMQVEQKYLCLNKHGNPSINLYLI